MNENNPPVAFPICGQVYSLNGIREEWLRQNQRRKAKHNKQKKHNEDNKNSSKDKNEERESMQIESTSSEKDENASQDDMLSDIVICPFSGEGAKRQNLRRVFIL